jgi:hypothetical protein
MRGFLAKTGSKTSTSREIDFGMVAVSLRQAYKGIIQTIGPYKTHAGLKLCMSRDDSLWQWVLKQPRKLPQASAETQAMSVQEWYDLGKGYLSASEAWEAWGEEQTRNTTADERQDKDDCEKGMQQEKARQDAEAFRHPFWQYMPVSMRSAAGMVSQTMLSWTARWEIWRCAIAAEKGEDMSRCLGRQTVPQWVRVPLGHVRSAPGGWTVAPDLSAAERAAATIDEMVKRACDDRTNRHVARCIGAMLAHEHDTTEQLRHTIGAAAYGRLVSNMQKLWFWMIGWSEEKPTALEGRAEAVLKKTMEARKRNKTSEDKRRCDELFSNGAREAHRWANAPNKMHSPGAASDGTLDELAHLKDQWEKFRQLWVQMRMEVAASSTRPSIA